VRWIAAASSGYDARVLAVDPGVPVVARGTRRWVTIAASIAVHGAALSLAIAFAPAKDAPAPPELELIPIAIVTPPPPVLPPPSGAGRIVADRPTGDAGTRGRRGHGREPPQRAQARVAPPIQAVPAPFSELSVHYDAPASQDRASSGGTSETGLGLGVAGAGTGEIGVGGLDVPPAPASAHSLARPPKSKFPYDHWSFLAPPQFIGSKVLLELTIDPRGNVRKCRVVHSVDPSIDQRTVAAASSFEFHPQLDDDGQPMWGRIRWEFEITSQT